MKISSFAIAQITLRLERKWVDSRGWSNANTEVLHLLTRFWTFGDKNAGKYFIRSYIRDKTNTICQTSRRFMVNSPINLVMLKNVILQECLVEYYELLRGTAAWRQYDVIQQWQCRRRLINFEIEENFETPSTPPQNVISVGLLLCGLLVRFVFRHLPYLKI